MSRKAAAVPLFLLRPPSLLLPRFHLLSGWRLGAQLELTLTMTPPQVHLTTDMGKNWKRISTYVAQFEWGAAVDGVFKPGMTTFMGT